MMVKLDPFGTTIPSELLRVARSLAPPDLYWWEEPTRDGNNGSAHALVGKA